MKTRKEILLADEAYEIVGACMEVYNEMGAGFLEAVYQECLEIELQKREIPFSSQVRLALSYKGSPLKNYYVPDLICFDQIIVELKSCKGIAREHQAQVYHYLKATSLPLGLIVNFGALPDLEFQRIPFTTKPRSDSQDSSDSP